MTYFLSFIHLIRERERTRKRNKRSKGEIKGGGCREGERAGEGGERSKQ